MSSDLLVKLSNIDLGLVIIVLSIIVFVLFISVIVIIAQTVKSRKNFKKFMQGKNAKNLGEKIGELFEDNKLLKESVEENRKELRRVKRNQEFAFQKVGLIKYDAFKQMGGMLSFSLALLNDQNDGFLINSVHSSDGCYSYTKEIKSGESDISLGEEEKKALEKALNSNNKTNRG